MSGYIGLLGTQFREFRKYALGAFAILIIAVGGFIGFRNTEFVQNSPNLARIANISSKDLEVRAIIWGMAWEGVKERPILGWGQSNFNYVFNKYYEPSLYAQEQWFDRSHNIIFDWLIAGGILGFLAYVSLFGACLYYLLVRPFINKDDKSFTVLERGVLLGILAGYLTHNFVVFDNIVSYIFFATILGLIHSRVSTPIAELEHTKVDEAVVTQFASPVLAVLLIGIFYFAHLPNMSAAKGVIDAVQEVDPAKRLEYFREAIEQDSFAKQEIVEQLSQAAISISRDPKIKPEVLQQYYAYTEEQLLQLAKDKPGDARVHVFIGSYYRSIGNIEKAAEQMQIAHELSPRKPSIIIQQGFIALTTNDQAKAFEYFKQAYELDTRNPEAKEYYAAALFQAGRGDEAIPLFDTDERTRSRFARSDYLLSAAHEASSTAFMIELMKERIKLTPLIDKTAAQNYATLAYLYFENGMSEEAVTILSEGQSKIPSFKATATCLSNNIKAGKDPSAGC